MPTAWWDSRPGPSCTRGHRRRKNQRSRKSQKTRTRWIRVRGPSVSYGSVNSYVTKLQTRLNELGYDCGTADGDFGYNTRNAVIRFQQDHGLVADGVVGQQTWPILYQGAQTPKNQRSRKSQKTQARWIRVHGLPYPTDR